MSKREIRLNTEKPTHGHKKTKAEAAIDRAAARYLDESKASFAERRSQHKHDQIMSDEHKIREAQRAHDDAHTNLWHGGPR